MGKSERIKGDGLFAPSGVGWKVVRLQRAMTKITGIDKGT